jgi:hypothetical protein
MTAADSDPGLCCSAGDCAYRANRIGHVTVRAKSLAASTRVGDTHTFWLPICDDHAHELRAGATLIEFHSGI